MFNLVPRVFSGLAQVPHSLFDFEENSCKEYQIGLDQTRQSSNSVFKMTSLFNLKFSEEVTEDKDAFHFEVRMCIDCDRHLF